LPTAACSPTSGSPARYPAGEHDRRARPGLDVAQALRRASTMQVIREGPQAWTQERPAVLMSAQLREAGVVREILARSAEQVSVEVDGAPGSRCYH
jgi:hypothetical protein